MLQGVYCLSSSVLGSTSLRTSDFSNALLEYNSDIGRLLCCIITVMSNELDVYRVKGGPCTTSPRCDSLLKSSPNFKYCISWDIYFLRYLSPSDGTRYQVINSEHCWFTVGHITLSIAGHFPYCELELCFVECAAFVEQFSDNCNVFGKSPCQVAGERSHNSGMMIPAQMLMLKWAYIHIHG